jgi:hypothetical protein
MCHACETNKTGFDELDADLDTAETTAEPKTFLEAQAEYAAEGATKVCPRCKGSGLWHGGFVNPTTRDCAICKGSGRVKAGYKYKTPEQYRQWKAEKNMRANLKWEREQAERTERYAKWAAANPAEIAWLTSTANRDRENGRTDSFAAKLIEDIYKFGGLTEGQRAAVTRSIERIAAAKAEREAAAPVVEGEGLAKLVGAFARAQASKLKSPKVRVGDIVFTLAKSSSANAGCLYVKTSGGTYLGKITPAAKFLKVRECTTEQEAQVVEIGRDPLAAAIAHGKRTGNCAICNRELTNAESVERGIGPICAEKFGW